MKNFVLYLASNLITFACICQTYTVSVMSSTYSPLTNGNLLVDEAWNDPYFRAPLGFSVNLFERALDTLYSEEFFAGGYVSSDTNYTNTNLIIGLSTDLIDRGFLLDTLLSPISYDISGMAGSRIFTLEFKNAGFYSGETSNGLFIDYINFQIRIIEETESIEIHIGPYSVENPALDFEGFSGPSIGLVEGVNFLNGIINGEILILAGDPLNPDLITDTTSLLSLIWPIPENTVYKFTRNSSSTSHEISSKGPNYFPNPSRGLLMAHSECRFNSSVYVLNLSGVLVQVDSEPDIINLSSLLPGVYFLKYMESDKTFYERVVLTR